MESDEPYVSRAYVVLKTEPGAAEDVADRLRQRRSVLMADAVDGEDSVIAVFQATDASDLAGAVFITARRIEGVTSTNVYLARTPQEVRSGNDVGAA